MAGVISAYRNIISDRWWIIKVAVFSLPLYLFFTNKKMVLSVFSQDYIFYMVLGIFYLGISSVLIHRNIQNKSPILPSLIDIFEVVYKTVGALISIIPSLVIIYFILYFVSHYVRIDNEIVFNIVKLSTVVLMFPFICLPVVIYSVNGRIRDVIKSFRIFFDSGRFIEHFLGYVIYSVLTVGLVGFLIYMGLKQYVGVDNVYVQFLYAFAITLYVLMLFSWASDLYGDVIPELEDKNQSERKIF